MIRSIPCATLWLCLGAAAGAQGSVSPADRLGLEGSSFSHFPLGRANMRLQQLHGDLPPGALLTGHAYRADAVQIRSRVEAFAVDLEVSVSMSPRTPAQASATFAQNAGPSPVVVLPRSVIAFPATERPGIDPAPTFEFAIPWQVPFQVPPGGGTVCVDIRVFGNFTAQGPDRNFSVWLDSHESRGDGRNEQPGYRYGQGCPPPGRTALPFGTFTLWHLGSGSQIDLSARNGVPDPIGGRSMVFVSAGVAPASTPWPGLPGCHLLTTADAWWSPGGNDAQGSFDGSLSLPLLPAGYRLWLQSGSAHLDSPSFAFGDGSTLITPPAAPAVVPAARVSASSDGSAATGTVSLAATVTRFL